MESLTLNGRFSALIELGAGFHPDLTGRDNIFLNGVILGMDRSEIKKRFDEIVDFAGINFYLDTPVKRYSSGMYARLGFAIAAHVDPRVFLVDEVLAVGDYSFQQKCYARMDHLRSGGTSLIFVTHNMDAVRRVCDKALVMYQGNNIFQGSSSEAVVAYSDAIREAARHSNLGVPEEDGLSQRVMTFDAEIERVRVLRSDGEEAAVVNSGAIVIVAIDILFHKDVREPIFSLTVRTPNGNLIYDTTTKWMGIQTPNFSAGERCVVEFQLSINLLEGEYQLGVDVGSADLTHYFDRMERALSFGVKGSEGAQGLVNLNAAIKFIQTQSSSTSKVINLKFKSDNGHPSNIKLQSGIESLMCAEKVVLSEYNDPNQGQAAGRAFLDGVSDHGIYPLMVRRCGERSS